MVRSGRMNLEPTSEFSAYCQENVASEDVVGRESVENPGRPASVLGQERRILVQRVVHCQAQLNISGHHPNGTQIEVTVVGYVRQVRTVKPHFGVLQRRLRGVVVESRAPDEAPLSRELQLPGRFPRDAQQMTPRRVY